jgi:hypothetical protein
MTKLEKNATNRMSSESVRFRNGNRGRYKMQWNHAGGWKT